MRQILKIDDQRGQSIIETLVGIFILVMGITAALGLANYSFGASTNVNKQIIGTGLAREGLEAVKNMRDTNWLKSDKDANCTDLSDLPAAPSNDASCYKKWQKPSGGVGYDIDAPGVAGERTYKLDFDRTLLTSADSVWVLTNETSNFALDIDANAYSTNPGSITQGRFYYPAAAAVGTSDYFRKITITEQVNIDSGNPDPYEYTDIGPRLLVKSDVWWKDKTCPTVLTWEQAKTSCRVRLEMFLTNWRVY